MEGRRNVFIGFIVSVVLGFVPSFLLFSAFNQSNFSFLRYKNFLLDFGASWSSWISILVIAIIIYTLMMTIQSNTKKVAILFLILALSVGFVFFYLYANFLLGNDILVKLSADKENIFFEDDLEQSLTFTISALMNPFCMAQCQYIFTDISTGEQIESGEFSIASVLPRIQEYSFNREGHIQGQALNRFELSCKSQKTKLCYTSGEESKRSILITLNYDISQEQKAINEISKKEIISLEKLIYNLSENLNDAKLNINAMDNLTDTEKLLPQFINLSNAIFDLNYSLEELKQAWSSQEYSAFEQELPSLKKNINNFSNKVDKFILLVNSNISAYNKATQMLNNSRNIFNQISLENLSESSCTDLNKVRAQFNETMKEFRKKTNLSYKEKIVNNISSEVIRADHFQKENTSIPCILMGAIDEGILNKIEIISTNNTIPEVYLEDPSPICCFYGKCEKCCDETCANVNYPTIFLHGHSISKDTSADYSLDAFVKIKSKLTEEGYIDAGTVIISQSNGQEGIWGKVNAPLEITGSYFFDVSKNETGGETIFPSKSDNIDTYAIRLNDLISTVKYKTGKEKVIIIAHSMGGLVTRRYAQIFPENAEKSIEKIILITSPNQGIESNIKNYCSLIGSGVECDDMSQDSLLINKLNNAKNMSIPVYNIIGTGCVMNNEKGDGIATESNQYLIYATNYYVDGTCNELSLELLHGNILNPEKYPKTYEIIKEILNEAKK